MNDLDRLAQEAAEDAEYADYCAEREMAEEQAMLDATPGLRGRY
jgi:hypothetical protein